jgi:uncharacterized protein YecE (DUF72 family)
VENADVTTQPSSSATPVWLGCSGWAYPTWKPDFYPPKTTAKKMLEYYATQLNSVEVNYTFRHLPRPGRTFASRSKLRSALPTSSD